MFIRQLADAITMTSPRNSYLSTVFAAALLLTACLPAHADDTATLLCNFEHGQLEFIINYTRGTANDATAIISDKEIIWSPGGNRGGIAVINRYTGIMQLSKGNKEFYGKCNKKPE
jgi:hypothetical protein